MSPNLYEYMLWKKMNDRELIIFNYQQTHKEDEKFCKLELRRNSCIIMMKIIYTIKGWD